MRQKVFGEILSSSCEPPLWKDARFVPLLHVGVEKHFFRDIKQNQIEK